MTEPQHSAADRLAALGITLPTPTPPLANYVPTVLSGSLLFVSGQLCFDLEGKIQPAHKGKLGRDVSNENGMAAAKFCAINVLAQAQAALGRLDRIIRCVRLGGFINATPDFDVLAPVMNGASDFMVAVLGDKGRHARSTIGVAQLPADCAVEVEAVFEVAI
ncbi:MAG: RidA family protein [Beijerinckiaceae bacterium]|nr:RidA family protein [Beijerinckiaceae bacterium]